MRMEKRRKRNLRKSVAFLLVFLLAFGGIIQVFAAQESPGSNNETVTQATYGNGDSSDNDGEPTYTETWDGRGKDSENCDLAGEDGRPESGGWIHWVFSTKGDSDDALLTLGGSGSDTYEPGEPRTAEVWHFYTPFFDLDELEATIELFGGDKGPGEGPGGGLVISDYCPGEPEDEPEKEIELEIIKKVVTVDDGVETEITEIDGEAIGEFEVTLFYDYAPEDRQMVMSVVWGDTFAGEYYPKPGESDGKTSTYTGEHPDLTPYYTVKETKMADDAEFNLLRYEVKFYDEEGNVVVDDTETDEEYYLDLTKNDNIAPARVEITVFNELLVEDEPEVDLTVRKVVINQFGNIINDDQGFEFTIEPIETMMDEVALAEVILEEEEGPFPVSQNSPYNFPDFQAGEYLLTELEPDDDDYELVGYFIGEELDLENLVEEDDLEFEFGSEAMTIFIVNETEVTTNGNDGREPRDRDPRDRDPRDRDPGITTTTTPTETIIDDPIPEGVPVPVPVPDPVIPRDVPEEPIVLDEEVPLGVPSLPQTGEGNPLYFYLAGLLLAGTGLILRRRTT